MKILLLILFLACAITAHSQMCDSTYMVPRTYYDTSYTTTITQRKVDDSIYVNGKCIRHFLWFCTKYELGHYVLDGFHIEYDTTKTQTITTIHDSIVKHKSVPCPPDIITNVNFGVLSAFRSMDAKINAAENLGVNYVRDAITLSRWNGVKSWDIDAWIANGYKVVLNINNNSLPSTFPTDLLTYEKQLRSVLSVYSPEVVVIENEEANEYVQGASNNNAHIGSLESYVNELKVAVKVCKEKGLKVTNGGLTPIVIPSLYNYYIKNNKIDSATWLKNQLGGISQNAERTARADFLINAYRNLELSYVNLHWYEPKESGGTYTGILTVMINYLQQQTGKKVITNETGVKNNYPFGVVGLMTEWKDAKSEYIIFYDSYGIGLQGAYPLTNADGELLDTGKAFKNEMQ